MLHTYSTAEAAGEAALNAIISSGQVAAHRYGSPWKSGKSGEVRDSLDGAEVNDLSAVFQADRWIAINGTALVASRRSNTSLPAGS